MKRLLVFAIVCLAVVSCKKDDDDDNGDNGNCSGYTAIPDQNFEQALIDLGHDDVVDGQVLSSNICSVDTLVVNQKNITDLKGIEDFTALTALSCYGNQLTNLDVTQNTALTGLECSHNQLTSLDVTQNTALTQLWCHNNQLTTLDVSQNITLTQMSFAGSELTSLDLSNNIALTNLWCTGSVLTSLDLSNNIALTSLWCISNYQLTCLNVKNGNNTNFIHFHIEGGTNPNLTCIEVDDPTWATQNWDTHNGQLTYSTNCNYPAGCF
jgi:hypothetical protein